jgi:hypothetical protein
MKQSNFRIKVKTKFDIKRLRSYPFQSEIWNLKFGIWNSVRGEGLGSSASAHLYYLGDYR